MSLIARDEYVWRGKQLRPLLFEAFFELTIIDLVLKNTYILSTQIAPGVGGQLVKPQPILNK